jgi:mannosylglycoprotein endo-beta-mannosidase
VKLQIAIANTLIFRLDIAQEIRLLSPGERWLRRMLKHAVLGLSSLECTIARQRSRIRWISEGDTNTKLFHVVANGRRTKNYIAAVRVANEIITDQERKVVAFTNAFDQMLGSIETREHSLDLIALDMKSANLEDLEALFSEEEVWAVVKEMPPDRALGPDGFIGTFYQRAWPVIKRDIMAGILKLGVGDGRGFARLNRAIITLIPKRPDALEIGDF